MRVVFRSEANSTYTAVRQSACPSDISVFPLHRFVLLEGFIESDQKYVRFSSLGSKSPTNEPRSDRRGRFNPKIYIFLAEKFNDDLYRN